MFGKKKMESSKSKNSDNLGVNIMGKNIRKGHIHENNYDMFLSSRGRQQDDFIYNIRKEDFKDFVQMHTGSQNTRLNKMRPPPLIHVQKPPILLATSSSLLDNNNVVLQRPPLYRQASSSLLKPVSPRNTIYGNAVESPTSAYIRYLGNSDVGSWGIQAHPHSQTYPPPVPTTSVAATHSHVPTISIATDTHMSAMNLQSPQSSDPLLSPEMQFPSSYTDSPLSPILPTWYPELIFSPGQFPPSPSGFPPIASPKRGDQ